MSYTRSLLNQIAAELGKSPADVEKFVDILENNWYDTEVSLKGIKPEELEAMGIPKFLAKKMVDKLASPAQLAPVQPTPSPGMEIETPNNNAPPKSRDAEILDSKLKQIFREYISPNEKIQSLTILAKIFSNIVREPENEKFRKLSLGNGKLVISLWRYIPIVELLTLLGFQKMKDDSLFLEYAKLKLDNIQFCLGKIEGEIKAANMSTPKFNPYAAHFTSKNPDFNVESLEKISNFESSKVYDQLKELKQRREQLIQNHKVITRPKIIPPTTETGIFSIKAEGDRALTDELEEDTSSDIYILKQAIIDFQRNFTGEPTFQNARKKEYELFMKEPFDLETIIKVRLPNKWTVEFNFSPNDTPRKLFAALDSLLVVSDVRYWVFVPPFVKDRICNDDTKHKIDSTFKELGMSPNARLELQFEDAALNKEAVLLKSLSG
jgi:hypothetical protein